MSLKAFFPDNLVLLGFEGCPHGHGVGGDAGPAPLVRVPGSSPLHVHADLAGSVCRADGLLTDGKTQPLCTGPSLQRWAAPRSCRQRDVAW